MRPGTHRRVVPGGGGGPGGALPASEVEGVIGRGVGGVPQGDVFVHSLSQPLTNSTAKLKCLNQLYSKAQLYLNQLHSNTQVP